MNTWLTRAMRTALLFPMLALTSCGGSVTTTTPVPGSSAAAPTAVLSTDQGARASTAGIDAARGIATVGTRLATMAVLVAPSVGSLPHIGLIPLTFDCTSRSLLLRGSTSTPNSVTVDKNGNVINAFFTTCRSGSTMLEGPMTIDVSGGTTVAFRLGYAAAPLSITLYESALSMIVTERFTTTATLSYTSGATATMVVNGQVDDVNPVRHTHDRYDLSNASVQFARSTAVIGVDPYDVASLTVNGSLTRTASVSDLDPTVKFTETAVLTDLAVVDKKPAAGSPAIYEYLSVNGSFQVATQPPGICIDGAFTIATNADLQIDRSTGTITAGQVTINGLAVVAYNADGSVTVTVPGTPVATYAPTGLTAICAL